MTKNILDSTQIKSPKTISEQVYEILREKIMNQDIKPGEVLLEVAVAEALRVSRTPVREAFSLLQHDALVARNPKGGVKVTELTLEDLLEVSELRTVFEVYSIELTCDRITEFELSKLQGTLKKIDYWFEESGSGHRMDVKALEVLNTEFHDILYSAAKSDYLERILEIVKLPILRYRPFSLENKKQRERSWKEHKQILTLLKEHDKKGLKVLIRKHVKDAGSAIAKKLKEARK